MIDGSSICSSDLLCVRSSLSWLYMYIHVKQRGFIQMKRLVTNEKHLTPGADTIGLQDIAGNILCLHIRPLAKDQQWQTRKRNVMMSNIES